MGDIILLGKNEMHMQNICIISLNEDKERDQNQSEKQVHFLQ